MMILPVVANLLVVFFVCCSSDVPSCSFPTVCMIVSALKPPVAGTTEVSYHCAYDLMFRDPLLNICEGSFDRNTSKDASTSQKIRPDFLFYINQKCVFRGEEGSPSENISVPCKQLKENVFWIYGEVDYLLAYAAVGFIVKLVALVRSSETSAEVITIDNYDLEYYRSRLALFRAILKLSVLLPLIANKCSSESSNEFAILERNNGITITVAHDHVLKSYPRNEQGKKQMQRLKSLLRTVGGAGVPNVIQLKDLSGSHSVSLQPVGICVTPSDERQLLSALKDILLALKHLHAMKVMHRDVRWSNVMQKDKKWFLIDFDDAIEYPQPSSTAVHLAEESHAPEMFISDTMHNEKVDMWGVGRLIHKAYVTVISKELEVIRDTLLDLNPDNRPSAEHVLLQINKMT